MNIQKYRKEKGMTVQQLADAAGISKRTLEDSIRRDDCLISNAAKIAAALDVTLDELYKTE